MLKHSDGAKQGHHPACTCLEIGSSTDLKRRFAVQYNYGSLLDMGFRFYDAERVGALPANFTIPWRGPSLLQVCSAAHQLPAQLSSHSCSCHTLPACASGVPEPCSLIPHPNFARLHVIRMCRFVGEMILWTCVLPSAYSDADTAIGMHDEHCCVACCSPFG